MWTWNLKDRPDSDLGSNCILVSISPAFEIFEFEESHDDFNETSDEMHISPVANSP